MKKIEKMDEFFNNRVERYNKHQLYKYGRNEKMLKRSC